MKYSVEIKNGIAKETLVFNGKEHVRKTNKTGSGSCSTDMEFNEQIENDGLSNSVLDQISDVLDGFLVSDLLNIAESEE